MGREQQELGFRIHVEIKRSAPPAPHSYCKPLQAAPKPVGAVHQSILHNCTTMARCALLLAALLLLAAPLAQAARPLPTGNDEPKLVPVGFIVSLNDGVATDTAAQALASTHGLHLRSTFGAVNAFHFE